MIKWEYLYCQYYSSDNTVWIRVRGGELEALAEYLRSAFPSNEVEVRDDDWRIVYVKRIDSIIDIHDALGEIGWELVTYQDGVFEFKRPRGGQKAKPPRNSLESGLEVDRR